ncbi:sulfurtransferase [Thermosulfurimonas dismutans]|uniref:Thiosulfate sulfurtransferase, rhodanese n=1 Tax=Thermosulfurimonas dismutans TaxID=999894 RepID=A0A179D7L8_9BACT|nr:rhodanese-like domain-containing protein [Thermosulfurimonas dismutans]OAQ21729.1 Thiosulfate sulfurtransferase, rhodanese [Thermosulfurimonas dismutans]
MLTKTIKILWICSLWSILTVSHCMGKVSRNEVKGAFRIWSTAQVEEALKKGKVVIIDARNIPEEDYLEEHLPGAVRLNNHMLTTKRYGVPGILLSDRELEEKISQAGLSENSRVIVYAQGETPKDYVDAARVLAILNYVGIKDTYFMDGGLAKWEAEGRPLAEGPVSVKKTNFKIKHPDRSIFCDLVTVEEILCKKRQGILVDARPIKYYEGRDQDPRLYRHGHIPGAIDLPASLFTKKIKDYYILKSPEEIKAILKIYGLTLDRPPVWISYCNTGHLASGLWFVARYVLHKRTVKIYDGSMVQYAKTNLPIEKARELKPKRLLAQCPAQLEHKLRSEKSIH